MAVARQWFEDVAERIRGNTLTLTLARTLTLTLTLTLALTLTPTPTLTRLPTRYPNRTQLVANPDFEPPPKLTRRPG